MRFAASIPLFLFLALCLSCSKSTDKSTQSGGKAVLKLSPSSTLTFGDAKVEITASPCSTPGNLTVHVQETTAETTGGQQFTISNGGGSLPVLQKVYGDSPTVDWKIRQLEDPQVTVRHMFRSEPPGSVSHSMDGENPYEMDAANVKFSKAGNKPGDAVLVGFAIRVQYGKVLAGTVEGTVEHVGDCKGTGYLRKATGYDDSGNRNVCWMGGPEPEMCPPIARVSPDPTFMRRCAQQGFTVTNCGGCEQRQLCSGLPR